MRPTGCIRIAPTPDISYADHRNLRKSYFETRNPRFNKPEIQEGFFVNLETREEEQPWPSFVDAHGREVRVYGKEPVQNQRISDFLELLPRHEFVAIQLFYWEGYSYQEISHILDLSLPTVRKRLYSARQRIKKIWKEETRA